MQAVARDWRTFTHRYGVDFDGTDRRFFGAGDFLQTEPPEHTTLRRIVKDRFAPNAIAALRPSVEELCRELVARLRERGGGDLVADYAHEIPFTIGLDMLGIPREDRDIMSQIHDDFTSREPVIEIPVRAVRAAAEVREYLTALGRRHLAHRADTLIGDMAGAVREGILDEQQLVGMSMLMLFAITATSVALIANALVALAQHPRQLKYVSQNPAEVAAAIEEVLRWETPLQHSCRIVTTPTEIAGTELATGQRVLLLFGSANRDGTRWPNADTFDVTREAKRNVAFGDGLHHCLGAPLARLEGNVATSVFLEAFPDYTVSDVGDQVSMPMFNSPATAAFAA